jgi:hypothetical protein
VDETFTTPQENEEERPATTDSQDGLSTDNDPDPVLDEPQEVPFSTTEQAIVSGDMKLDAKGRMPGIYLDDLEEAERLRRGQMIAEVHDNLPDERVINKEINVASSPLPPIQVKDVAN